MKSSVPNTIFARMWAVWGIISFVVTFLFIYPIFLLSFLINDKWKSQAFFISVSRYWMKVWLFIIGCRLKINGLHHFQPNENYIVVFNHNTMLDIPLSSPFLPGANKTIAKKSFASIPLFGLFYKKGSVLVDRKDNKSRTNSYEEMKEVIAQNMHMCLYPEGTRNRTTALLKPFYDGAFRLSLETGKPIVPCIIRGTNVAMPIDKGFYLMPTPLSLTYLPPVESGDLTVDELKEKVYGLMLSELKK
jgi:1-acyl-sn-glycerol-3-phosphate acyltransferase